MSQKEIPDSAIEIVAEHINSRSNKPHGIPPVGTESNIETPQIFEILPFGEIDDCDRRFYAIDGSYNSEEFYNGLAIAIYGAGYICFQHGKQVRMNSLDDPVILGQAYHPENILVTNEDHLSAIYDELQGKLPDWFVRVNILRESPASCRRPPPTIWRRRYRWQEHSWPGSLSCGFLLGICDS